MKPVDQTTFGVPKGNCFSACVASLLEISVADVPWFMGSDDWFADFCTWLRPRGLYAVTFLCDPQEAWCPAGYYIMGGQSARGPHAVVARGREMIHDPHPSRAGLTKMEDCTLLVPLDPSTLQPREAP